MPWIRPGVAVHDPLLLCRRGGTAEHTALVDECHLALNALHLDTAPPGATAEQ